MTATPSGSGSWRRRRADASANLSAVGGAGPGDGSVGGRRAPRIERCIAVHRSADGYELRISGTHLTAGAVPITGRVGGRQLAPIRATSPQLLTTSVDSCEVGDRLELDLGPFGVAVGKVERIEEPSRPPWQRFDPLDRLLSWLRDRRPWSG